MPSSIDQPRSATLPLRLKPPKMRVRPQLQKIWPRHRRWVKSHGCCVPGCDSERIEFAHLRSAANAGMALKPHDAFAVSLCRDHHDEQHRLGIAPFEASHKIDLWAIAAEFVRRSPDREMRLSVTFVGVDDLRQL